MSKELQRKQAPRNYGFRNNQRWIKEALTHFCCHSVAKSCLTLCDPMDCSTPGFPVLQHLLEFAQTHVHWVVNAIHPSHPLSSPSPPALNLSHHQGLFQLVNSASGGQNIRASASASVLPVNIQGWFRLELTGLISLLSKGLSRIFPNTTVLSISCSALRAG